MRELDISMHSQAGAWERGNEQKKKIKINNLINELSNKLKKICNKGSKGSPKWELCDDQVL